MYRLLQNWGPCAEIAQATSSQQCASCLLLPGSGAVQPVGIKSFIILHILGMMVFNHRVLMECKGWYHIMLM